MTEERDEKPIPASKTVDRVLDAGALRALGHPLRIRIFDILSQFGPQTASSLAEQLGESSGSTSYHLRALAKHDIIREVEGRGTGRERWWERPRGSVTMAGPEVLKTPAGRAASQMVIMETYRRRNDDLMRYLEGSMRSNSPSIWEATLSLANTRLTSAQWEELSERLQDIITEAVNLYRDQDDPEAHPYSIRLDIIPLDADRSNTSAKGDRS